MQKLNLHYAHNGVIEEVPIENTNRGLHIAGSNHYFDVLRFEFLFAFINIICIWWKKKKKKKKHVLPILNCLLPLLTVTWSTSTLQTTKTSTMASSRVLSTRRGRRLARRPTRQSVAATTSAQPGA